MVTRATDGTKDTHNEFSFKIRVLAKVQPLFPIWSLDMQVRVIESSYEDELQKTNKRSSKHDELTAELIGERAEYLEKLRSIRCRRLIRKAERMFIYISDLEWVTGNYGDNYLERASESKLYHAVREQRDRNNEYRLKLAAAVTGIIGSLIGLIAVSMKK